MSLTKILSLKKYSFLTGSLQSGLTLTPISQLMKQNIASDWIKRNLSIPSVEFFVQPLIVHSDAISRNQFNLVKPIIDNYSAFYRHLTDNPLIGIISRLTCLRDSKSKSYLKTKKYDSLVLALFCPQKESHIWHQKLLGNHNHWFRNLTKSPLVTDFLTKSEDKPIKKWTLSYKMDDLEHRLETIENLKQSSNSQLLSAIDRDLILCHIDLENSLLAFLTDAFSDKNFINDAKEMKMKISPSLAPFKIAFTFRDGSEVNQEMIEMTKYMVQSLKVFDVSVLPFSPNRLSPIDSNDELGIPYTVIVDEKSSRNGIVGIRNRDTGLEHNIHIRDFQKSMCLTLEVIHPSKIRNRG